MGIRIYNTLSRRKEDFKPLVDDEVRMYVCGPTVYSKAHIGHAMSSIIFDVIKRYLLYRGYKVNVVMNYTDVDDKIIARANELKTDPSTIANQHIEEYQQHLADLNVLPATAYPKASQEMDKIIDMIEQLVNKEYAYPVGGDVYYRVLKDKEYGKLSGRKIEDMLSGTRKEVDGRKETPMDFALWKAAKPGEPAWDSPWGKGRPGWHIECSAMNMAYLGEQIDIHGGGNDLVFPHHENEIAQTEALTGKIFAKYWVHNGMMQLAGEKMSKSLGNLITIEEYLKTHAAESLRMVILNSGYRNPLTYSEEILGQADRALDRLRSGLKPALPGEEVASGKAIDALNEQMTATKAGFEGSMDDDFNSAGALSQLFDLVRAINTARAENVTEDLLSKAQSMLRELSVVLGLELDMDKKEKTSADPFVDYLVELRTAIRKQKLYELSDQVRDRLLTLHVIIEDTKDGSTWHWE
jgi:cysteinyl-tRNA synthetase